MDTLYLQQTDASRSNMFAVPYGTNYALFYSHNLTEEFDPTSISWTIDIMKSDESGYNTYAVDTEESIAKVDDSLFMFDLLGDGDKPLSLYNAAEVINPVYLITRSGTTYFHLLREVQKPQSCQIGPNRFIVTWWSPFYDTYDVMADGYTDDDTKMIRASNTTRPTDTYSHTMLGSFLTFMKGTHKWNDGTAKEVRNVLVPVFTVPSPLLVIEKKVEEAGGSIADTIQAIEPPGTGVNAGTIGVKSIVLKSDLTLSPNFIQTGDRRVVAFYKL